jgi:hypothetical protein
MIVFLPVLSWKRRKEIGKYYIGMGDNDRCHQILYLSANKEGSSSLRNWSLTHNMYNISSELFTEQSQVMYCFRY